MYGQFWIIIRIDIFNYNYNGGSHMSLNTHAAQIQIVGISLVAWMSKEQFLETIMNTM